MSQVTAALFDRPGLLVINTAGDQAIRERIDEAVSSGASMLKPHWLDGLSDLSIALLDGGKGKQHSFRTPDGVLVAFDGYLSDITTTWPPDTSIANPARLIAAMYRQHGIECLLDLRGSYNCVITDAAHYKGWLFNDRFGSRPMFQSGVNSNQLVVAPRTSDIARLLPDSAGIDRSAVGAFIVSAGYYLQQTTFTDIRLFPQAGIVELGAGTHEISRYWRMQFPGDGMAVDEAALLEECDALLEQAVRRSLAVTENPVLATSGGVDSRILLAYLRRIKADNLSLVSYGKNDADQNDLAVARQLARLVDLPLTEFTVDPCHIGDCVDSAIWNVDGRADLLDAGSLTSLWERLGEDHDAMIQGDQCFGWHGHPHSPADALALFGRVNLDSVPRLADWIDPSIYGQVCHGIADTLQAMLPDNEAPAEDIRDILFFEQAVGLMQNAFASARRVRIEQVRPLMDEDVLMFITRLPARLRQDKALLRKMLESFSDFSQVPLASSHALPKPTDYIGGQAVARSAAFRLLRERLNEGLHDQLASWIDVRPVLSLIDALEQGGPLPPPHRRWYQYLPGFSGQLRRRLAQSTNPFLIIRRLAVQDMYLKMI